MTRLQNEKPQKPNAIAIVCECECESSRIIFPFLSQLIRFFLFFVHDFIYNTKERQQQQKRGVGTILIDERKELSC